MSSNLVHIHPLYVFVSVVGTFWSCACLLLFFSLLFCLPSGDLTLFGSKGVYCFVWSFSFSSLLLCLVLSFLVIPCWGFYGSYEDEHEHENEDDEEQDEEKVKVYDKEEEMVNGVEEVEENEIKSLSLLCFVLSSPPCHCLLSS